MKQFIKSIFPDILTLSDKNSEVSTKRYGDLRLLNHVILQSWAILILLAYNGMWHEIGLHFVFLAALCFGRGLLAKDNFLNLLNKNVEQNKRSD